MEKGLEKYVKLYEELRAKGLSEEVVVAVLQEVGKDGRVERMHGTPMASGNGNGDSAATSKQIGFLKRLGVEVSVGLTKKQASELIDAHSQGAQEIAIARKHTAAVERMRPREVESPGSVLRLAD